MTISNAVTASRIFLAPLFFVVFFLPRWFGVSELVVIVILWVLFVAIELSDLFDGHIARKLSQTSDTGKLLDPFADSLSRLTYFFCFTSAGYMPIWIFVVLLYRDLGVGFIRLMILRRGAALSARVSGKLKAWIYAVAGGVGLFHLTIELLPESLVSKIVSVFTIVVFYSAGAIAIWSLVDYASLLITKKRAKKQDSNPE